MPETRIDAHCHLFNGDYALREALAILWAVWRRTYRLPADLRGERDAMRALVEGHAWPTILSYIARLYAPAIRSCEENYREEIGGYDASGMPPGPVHVTPLMMDIFYMFADEPAEGAPRAAEPGPADEALIARFARDVSSRLSARLEAAFARLPVARLRDHSPEIANRVRAIIAEHARELRRGEERDTTEIAGIAPSGMEMSWGFREHLADLLRLRQAYPGQVFPFLAVDPRRRGILEFVKSNVTRRGPFYGVKVYPPLGYYPGHPTLLQVYDHCRAHDLPVTAHCQPFSFAHAGYEPEAAGRKYADPAHWAQVLKERRDLRLNLAHFGGIDYARQFAQHPGADTANWTRTIICLLEYPNVYADLAAFAAPEAAGTVDTLLGYAGHVPRKLMFGTDYVICLLNPTVDGKVRRYFDLFPDLARRWEALFGDNAQRFLNAEAGP